ncbi:MAG: carbon starvation protein A [Candidatus Omnitrophica bacterium]|nr:carbon starvation protein A [Candidatus Omnitrophota bacterium]MBU1925220.1 carbon starvation protein A [Candidatus Omnitrophota bacterium]
MNSLALIILAFSGFLAAYHTYGKFLARRIFRVDVNAVCPSYALQDNIDFVPTKKSVLFGHHFTSIAGLGPIVGPAIGVIWGWVPALAWVFLGSILMGAVHDFGALILSLRAQGRSLGDITATLINHRVRTLFLIIIFFGIWIVIAVFALIIAILFTMYPESVLPVWLQIPIALCTGHLIYKKGKNPLWVGIAATAVMYITIVLGAYLPIKLISFFGLNPLALWIIALLVYVYIASTLPVQKLLQPRDFINSFQLLIAMLLLTLGIFVTRPKIIAPAINLSPLGAPPMFPFIFIIIACGAISGFHCLVSSGTSSKQCDTESNALCIGYGSMLLEGALACLVIVAVCAGLGLGLTTKNGQTLTGAAAFAYNYSSWTQASGLQAKLGSFITGAANVINPLGIPQRVTIALMGVFLVSFAATTLDTSTRIQRYVISELACAWKIKLLTKKHPATIVAVLSAFILAFSNGNGNGALSLWPLFGTVNQLLAALALLVISIYLIKKRVTPFYTAIPMFIMLFVTGWAMLLNLKTFYAQKDWLLFCISISVFGLEIWMVIESAFVLKILFKRKR